MDATNVSKWEVVLTSEKSEHSPFACYGITNGSIFLDADTAGNKEDLQGIVDTLNAADKPVLKLTRDEFYMSMVEFYTLLSIALCRVIRQTGHDQNTGVVWKSKIPDALATAKDVAFQHDLFLLGIGLNKPENETIYFFLPLAKWEDCWFARELTEPPFNMQEGERVNARNIMELINSL